MYDIAYFRGHGNGDKGAVGNNRTEFDICQKRVNKVVEYLKKGGMSVLTNTSTQNNYEKNLLNGVKLKYNFAITDHMNASSSTDARGVEIWVPNAEKNFTLENNILNEISKYLKSRGIRKRDFNSGNWCYAEDNTYSIDYYKEIRQSWNNGISHDIFEIGFITNFYDVQAVEKYNNEISLIIANCILEFFGYNKITEKKTIYRVVANSYYDKELAKKDVEKLKKMGYEYTYIKED